MQSDAAVILPLIVPFGVVFGLLLIAYEDGVPMGMFKKLRCKLGWHKYKKKIAMIRMSLYYCSFCKKKRIHPPLTLIEGEKKEFNNFKF